MPKDNKRRVEALLPCITNSEIRNSWRPTSDRNFYISFDIKQLIQAYGQETIVKEMIQAEKFSKFSSEVISEFLKLIQAEWLDRAQFPVKILPAKVSADFMRDINICFVLPRPFTDKEQFYRKGRLGGDTLSFRYPELRQNTPAQYKVIMLNQLATGKLTNRDKKTFLHELSHGLCGMKHFRPYNQGDKGPFCRYDNKNEPMLNCSDTVMSYEDDCYPILVEIEKLAKDPDIQKLKPEEANEFHSSTKIRKKFENKIKAYPTQLGWLDLIAIQKFTAEWLKQCEQYYPIHSSATITAQIDPYPENILPNSQHTRHLLQADDLSQSLQTSAASQTRPWLNTLFSVPGWFITKTPSNADQVTHSITKPISTLRESSTPIDKYEGKHTHTSSLLSQPLSLTEWVIVLQCSWVFFRQFSPITLPSDRITAISERQKNQLEEILKSMQQLAENMPTRKQTRAFKSSLFSDQFAFIERNIPTIIQEIQNILTIKTASSTTIANLTNQAERILEISKNLTQKNHELRHFERAIKQKERKNRDNSPLPISILHYDPVTKNLRMSWSSPNDYPALQLSEQSVDNEKIPTGQIKVNP